MKFDRTNLGLMDYSVNHVNNTANNATTTSGRARFYGIGFIGTTSDQIMITVGYQQNNYHYDHGNGIRTQNITGDRTRSIIVRY